MLSGKKCETVLQKSPIFTHCDLPKKGFNGFLFAFFSHHKYFLAQNSILVLKYSSHIGLAFIEAGTNGTMERKF